MIGQLRAAGYQHESFHDLDAGPRIPLVSGQRFDDPTSKQFDLYDLPEERHRWKRSILPS